MTGVFYLFSALAVSLLPALNGYLYISAILALLVMISPVRVLQIQLCALLLWLVACFLSIEYRYFSLYMPDEYYLYLLYALIFMLGLPFYISHRKQPYSARTHVLLMPLRYLLFAAALLLFVSALFRFFHVSNALWAAVCLIYGLYLPKRRHPIHILTAVCYLILGGLLMIVTLVLLEAGTRLFLVAPPLPSGHYMPHTEAIFTLRPNASAPVILKNNRGEMILPMADLSSQGIRDREYGPKSENEYRIVMIGDSFTMGHGLESDETIDSVLEYLLASEKTGIDIHVINCGVGAYAPWQERIFLNERGLTFEPDLVILQLYPSNDVAGSYSKIGKYLQSIDTVWEETLINYRRRFELPFRVERFVKQKSQAYRMALATINRTGVFRPLIIACRLFEPVRYPPVISQTPRPCNEEVCLVDWYPELEEAWGIFEESIRGIRDDCRERGVDLIAYVHGGIPSLRPEDWENLNKAFPDTPYEMNKDIRITNELLEALDIPYADVFASLQKYPVEYIYYIYDGHFNPQGAEVVAMCLRDYLMENDFMKE